MNTTRAWGFKKKLPHRDARGDRRLTLTSARRCCPQNNYHCYRDAGGYRGTPRTSEAEYKNDITAAETRVGIDQPPRQVEVFRSPQNPRKYLNFLRSRSLPKNL